jgi:hypothetical protein
MTADFAIPSAIRSARLDLRAARESLAAQEIGSAAHRKALRAYDACLAHVHKLEARESFLALARR